MKADKTAESFPTVVTFVNLNDLHEFASLIYNTYSKFTGGDLHLSLRFTRLQIYNFSKRQGSDLQLLRRRGPHWFATKQSLCFSESMKAFWGDFALVDKFGKSIVKGLRKEAFFRKNYASNKARKLKVLSNFVPVLLCIIDDFSFNERLNSKCFLSFQQNSIYRCNMASFFRLFKEICKDQFQPQIDNNALKNAITELIFVQAIQILRYLFA